MKVKELKKILRDYPNDTEILIWWLIKKTISTETWYYEKTEYQERPLDLQDIVDSNYDWNKRIIISQHSLYPYQ